MQTIERTGKFKQRWDSMTAAQRRVASARDALRQLRAKRICAKASNVYLEHNLDFAVGVPIHRQLPKMRCTVCAVGAAFVGFVSHFDGLVSDYGKPAFGRHDLENEMKGVFPKNYLRNLEGAFEGWGRNPEETAFYDQYPDDDKRLRAILLNLIKNKGDFKP